MHIGTESRRVLEILTDLKEILFSKCYATDIFYYVFKCKIQQFLKEFQNKKAKKVSGVDKTKLRGGGEMCP